MKAVAMERGTELEHELTFPSASEMRNIPGLLELTMSVYTAMRHTAMTFKLCSCFSEEEVTTGLYKLNEVWSYCRNISQEIIILLMCDMISFILSVLGR